MFDCWKHLLRQQDIAVILAVHLHSRVDKYQFSNTTCDTATDTITDVRSRRLRSMYRFNWCISPIVLRVEWWFDGRFSSINHMKSNCTSYSSCLQRVRRATLLLCATSLLWHSLAGDHDKLFCVQSVSEYQFHMRSHDLIGAFLDCLPDWTHGLWHSQCSRWHIQNTVRHCPVADQSYPLFGLSLTECRYFHILSTCYEPVWQILGLKELMCK